MVKADSKVVVDVSALTTMRQIKNWQAANAAVDIEGIAQQMAQFVKSWSFAGDPADAEAYMDLSPAEWGQVIGEVSTAIASLFQK